MFIPLTVRTALASLAFAIVAVLLVGGRPVHAQPATTESSPQAALIPAPTFSTDGFALVVYTGSSIEGLKSAARDSGASGVWVQDARGVFQLLPVTADAPAFLGAAFEAAIPSVQGPIGVTLVRPVPMSPSTITLADDRGTVRFRVGDTFTLMLGETVNWSFGPLDTTVIRPVPTLVALPPGTQGMYVASGAGSFDLTASGGPVCAPAQPCPAIARLFRVHLIVTQ